MTTYLGKSCSFCLPRVPFVNCRQFMYLVISLLVLRAGYGIWLYQFLIIAYLFTFQYLATCTRSRPRMISQPLYYLTINCAILKTFFTFLQYAEFRIHWLFLPFLSLIKIKQIIQYSKHKIVSKWSNRVSNYCWNALYEMSHGTTKSTKLPMSLTKTQMSLDMHQAWSVFAER